MAPVPCIHLAILSFLLWILIGFEIQAWKPIPVSWHVLFTVLVIFFFIYFAVFQWGERANGWVTSSLAHYQSARGECNQSAPVVLQWTDPFSLLSIQLVHEILSGESNKTIIEPSSIEKKIDVICMKDDTSIGEKTRDWRRRRCHLKMRMKRGEGEEEGADMDTVENRHLIHVEKETLRYTLCITQTWIEHKTPE